MSAGKSGTQEGLLAINRQKEIVNMIVEVGSVKVAYLSSIFGVTEETIRRDLEKLESEGQLKRIHGGAVSLKDGSMELPLKERTVYNIEQKRAIGRLASTLVEDGDIIALDSSTTTLELAKCITEKSLSVLTNGVLVVMELGRKPNVTLLCTGGYYSEDHHAFFGESAQRTIEGHHISKLFISCKGFHVDWGISESHEQQAIMKRKFVTMADEVNLLVDSSKVNVKALTKTAEINKIHRVITDSGVKDSTIKALKDKGIEVLVAKVKK